jgi:DNA-binding MarR family transcriptional regulator
MDRSTPGAKGLPVVSSTAGRATDPQDPAGAVDDMVTAVLVASRVLVAVSARSLADVEETVTVTQFRTLVILEAHEGINLNQLAELLGVNASTAMRMIDRLLATGLVTRRDNPTNRREVLLGLTQAGRGIVHRVTSRRRAEIKRIITAIPPAQRTTLIRALRSFAEAAGEPEPTSTTPLGW